MTKRFTQGLLSFMLIIFLGFLLSPTEIIAQNCANPSGLSTGNISNFTATANWANDNNVHHYRIRYKEVGSSSWLFEYNATGTNYNFTGLNFSSSYTWQAKAYCDSLEINGSGWSVAETFVTTNDPLDCNLTPNGLAFLDSCGNCVGGTTNELACIDFTPTASITLSTTECNTVSDLTFIIAQDPNEPDISSSVFTSGGGFFDFTDLDNNDSIGSGIIIAGGGFVNINATLLVGSIMSSQKILVKVMDDNSGSQYGTFTIENVGGGILIDATSPSDGNNVTSGNSQNIVLNGLFVNPAASNLTFTSTINSEMGDQAVQSTVVTIACSQTCPQLGDGNCDGIVNLADLTLVINHWLQSTTIGEDGDVVGSLDGFVNLEDLTLVINNWLQSTP